MLLREDSVTLKISKICLSVMMKESQILLSFNFGKWLLLRSCFSTEPWFQVQCACMPV